MAGKMEPEEAFRLIDPRGVKQRALTPGETVEKDDAEDQLDGSPTEAPKWLRYTIISITVIVSLCFVGVLASGVYLLYDKKEPELREFVQEEPLLMFSEDEVNQRIEATLRAFLDCTNTQDRLQYVIAAGIEHDSMVDYYEKRGNLDVTLWKIKLIKRANLEGIQIWMIAYLDVKKSLRYMRFERVENQFLIQWSSSVAYGKLPWNTFARSQPREPVQMRCYILRHAGTPPAGFDPLTHLSFVVENQRGEFTEVAVMRRDAEGAHLLELIPAKSSNPVNLMLKYTVLANGARQLTIDKLLHFQWHQHTMTYKGRPIQLK